MEQYLKLLTEIKERGTYKAPARENMPGTTSLFGYQMRMNLADGFPLLTTKKLSFKNIVTELIWFLRGDTNIKFLVEQGCNIWNEDAYNYYKKICSEPMDFETFIFMIKENNTKTTIPAYTLGDCGMQYGKLWREWDGPVKKIKSISAGGRESATIDQMKDLIEGLKINPMGRRHIITAWNPATLEDMALNACHAFVQFNCRPLTTSMAVIMADFSEGSTTEEEIIWQGPKYYLDCQMYQRSADVFLGVPYNIASYALLTEIVAKLTGMIAGEFIHTFGDVHIYDNHKDQVEEQLKRVPAPLPKLHWNTEAAFESSVELDDFVNGFEFEDLFLSDYNPQPAIKAKLSTGLK